MSSPPWLASTSWSGKSHHSYDLTPNGFYCINSGLLNYYVMYLKRNKPQSLTKHILSRILRLVPVMIFTMLTYGSLSGATGPIYQVGVAKVTKNCRHYAWQEFTFLTSTISDFKHMVISWSWSSLIMMLIVISVNQ